MRQQPARRRTYATNPIRSLRRLGCTLAWEHRAIGSHGHLSFSFSSFIDGQEPSCLPGIRSIKWARPHFWEGLTALKLTPGQLREMLDLTKDTYRHWKQALAPLAGRNGYRPCFSTGDLLAVAMVKALVETAGIKVSTLQPVAGELFRICNEMPWASLERSSLVLDPAEGRLDVVAEMKSQRTEGLAILLACRPIVTQLRARLLTGQHEEVQRPLHFPPAVVTGERRKTGSGQP